MTIKLTEYDPHKMIAMVEELMAHGGKIITNTEMIIANTKRNVAGTIADLKANRRLN
jgi:L-2-hydroxyglutarate oxidase LhgO